MSEQPTYKEILPYKTSWFKRILRYIWLFLLYSNLSVIIFRFIPVPLTPLMIWRLPDQIFNKERVVRLYKDWEPIQNISIHMQNAIISSEDQKFFNHHGFDFEAIEKALKSNKKGKRIKGGSTISQQTAKNLFLIPVRNYVRKAFEAYFTVLIEFYWSKERILEVYLNIIEFGDGIYGVQAASDYYFDIPASQLSNSHAAQLASIVPNPLVYDLKNPNRKINKKTQWIKRNMKYIDQERKKQNN
ncbi:MAG: monofunctional biosynthetic peptidoglycan transglycosylase [Chitinophagales bacterium]|jgi:monofunctional biosynthetic peptidoglycan transglycosylase|nr:monofunctional biosynthetic peptidoglycan transglycosylase [Chitinophagales bacterium]